MDQLNDCLVAWPKTVNYYSQGLLEVRHEVLVNDLHLLIAVHVVLQLMRTLN